VAGSMELDVGRKLKLWHRVVLGLFLGITFGFAVQRYGNFVGITDHAHFLTEYIKPIGTIFINLIKMVVVPLIFFSLISGITGMNDPKALSRIGLKATIAFMITVAFAVTIGLVAANIFHPGTGASLHFSDIASKVDESSPVIRGIKDIILDIVPSNGIGAMAEGHILQVVFFAIFVGITLNLMGETGKSLVSFCHDAAKLIFLMIGIIIRMSPYGVFALMAWVVGTQGLDIIMSLGKLVLTVVAACFFQYLIFGLLIAVFGRLSPMPFYRKSLEYQTLAFSTSSSKATLTTSMNIAEHKMGVSKSTTSFVLPLGASINMDGTAIYLGICAVFFAQALGVDLQMSDYIMIILTSTIASIGAAGYPGGALMMMSMVLTAVNLPIEGIALIAGVDRILDMLRTTINITGDTTITLLVDRSEGKLNEKIYYS
jgi:Na+/H+-dicarboxylate symporter